MLAEPAVTTTGRDTPGEQMGASIGQFHGGAQQWMIGSDQTEAAGVTGRARGVHPVTLVLEGVRGQI
ncbi:hypothetical protein, partial [Streptomyces sp. 5-6(2022)]|uniref:hypothetical protein n=1 Tax=Streptomyces sp. 5-6(2022) TaxID=2936510 RepID=UPI0031BB99C6